MESMTSKQSVHSFFTPTSQREPDRTTWHVLHNTLLRGRYIPSKQSKPSQTDDTIANESTSSTGPRRRKIAAFDLDSTLIVTASGKVWGRDPADWKWWHSCVPSTLQQLYNDGYHIAILSNQGSVSLGGPSSAKSKNIKADQRSSTNFKTKVASILDHLKFPVTVYAATARDRFRKPRTGMWKELVKELVLDDPNGFDRHASFFVGDAGGREALDSRKADFACSDRDLASNIGIKFQTPEEFFLKEAALPFLREFQPQDWLDGGKAAAERVTFSRLHDHDIDIVIFVGSPGAGKSTFYWTKLAPLGYARVNQDTLKTRDKCVKVARSHLSENRSVVVDNTNADKATRAVWIALAKEMNIPARCVYFTASTKLCEHNDTVRALALLRKDRAVRKRKAEAEMETEAKRSEIIISSPLAPSASQLSEHKVQEEHDEEPDDKKKQSSPGRPDGPVGSDLLDNISDEDEDNEEKDLVFNPERRLILPHSAFAGYRSRFQEPDVAEGLEDIVRVDFYFEGDDPARAMWSQYWI